MASIKSIKQRIKGAQNTAKITKAMEVVSATKMRRSQQFALRARPYAVASLELMRNILTRTEGEVTHPLFSKRAVARRALLVITADKGLAGAINTNILKKADAWIAAHGDLPFALIVVGKKAKEYYERRGVSIAHAFTGFGDYSTQEQTRPVAETLVNGYLDGSWDEVEAVYTNFRTSLLQESVVRPILPATEGGLFEVVRGIIPETGKFAASALPASPESIYRYEYVVEPSPEEVLSVLVPQLIRLHIHHVILESNASEHSARMVAMKSASDNARELITDFTRLYNQVRQAGITRELAEISAGAEALQEV
ncbi:ATP synthase F1 subunit gamma [Candidatus Kaiserbacteria bacterium]|nr:ATP synthase F1 subunit gamma [Candidatus Kaiserbacteria bacterium]